MLYIRLFRVYYYSILLGCFYNSYFITNLLWYFWIQRLDIKVYRIKIIKFQFKKFGISLILASLCFWMLIIMNVIIIIIIQWIMYWISAVTVTDWRSSLDYLFVYWHNVIKVLTSNLIRLIILLFYQIKSSLLFDSFWKLLMQL